MSTASLLRWIALVVGAELAVRGHLADRRWICHAGAALFAVALAAIARPTRARRAGAVAAGVLLALAAIDASIGAFGEPAPRTAADTTEPTPPESALDVTEPPAPGSTVILLLGGRDRDGGSALPPGDLGDALRERLQCEPSIAVVAAADGSQSLGDAPALRAALAQFHPALVVVLAANEVLDALVAESAALDFPAAEPVGPRGSPLVRALERAHTQWRRERAWRQALDRVASPDPRTSRVFARYRALVLAAHRSDTAIALVIPSLAVAPDAPEHAIRSAEIGAPRARAWLLASRAHARGLRALAASYGILEIDTRPALQGDDSSSFAALGRLSPAGRDRLARVV